MGGNSPFGAPSKPKVKASSAAKPFTGAGNQNLFKEMDNLSPFMQPEQMEEKPWWQNISLGQVVSPAAAVHDNNMVQVVQADPDQCPPRSCTVVTPVTTPGVLKSEIAQFKGRFV